MRMRMLGDTCEFESLVLCYDMSWMCRDRQMNLSSKRLCLVVWTWVSRFLMPPDIEIDQMFEKIRPESSR